MKRNRRSGVEDRWFKAVKLPDGTTATVESATYGKGNRWRARYVDDSGKEHARVSPAKLMPNGGSTNRSAIR